MEHLGTLGVVPHRFMLADHSTHSNQWDQKSVNLQYNTLGPLDNGTKELSTKHLKVSKPKQTNKQTEAFPHQDF